MAAYDRDATLERQQIREISLNVARRLRQVLDRAHYIPAALRPEVESSVRIITGIQRDVDQIMAGLPADEALDFAILTHIMGGQRHALDLLEVLEEKLAGSRSSYQRDSARVHQALLAVSREIERDALRYAAESAAAPPQHQPQPPPAGYAYAPPAAPAAAAARPAVPQPPPPAYGRPARRAPAKKPPPRTAQLLAALPRLRDTVLASAKKPVPVALAALSIGAGLVIAAQGLIPSGADPAQSRLASADALEQKRDGRLDDGASRGTETGGLRPAGEITVAAATPAMEQPYLVVLATRRSTEELQQDYRTFKGAYPDLLGNAKARVDRVQGQDRQTWYRLSLIPPRAQDEAKALCSSLRKAGLTGCWIRPVPVN